MNFQIFLSNALVDRIGLALIHFLWQATAIAVVLALVLRMLRHASPQSRYLAAWAALVAMTVCVPMTAYFIPALPRSEIAAEHRPDGKQIPVQSARNVENKQALAEMPQSDLGGNNRAMNGAETAAADDHDSAASTKDSAALLAFANRDNKPSLEKEGSLASLPRLLQPALSWIVGVWLFGTMMLSAWHLGGFRHLLRMKRHSIGPVPSEVEQIVIRLSKKMKIHRPVSVLAAQMALVPTVLGWLRPVILLPPSILGEMSPEQLEMILAHELAHVRRLDYLWNLLQIAIETVLFYHPAVWWVSRRIREERENCCDRQAVSAMGNPLAYAGALMRLAEIRCQCDAARVPAGSIAASGGSLEARIRRVLGLPTGSSCSSNSWVGGILAVLLLIVSLSVGIVWAGGQTEKEAAKTTVTEEKKNERPAESLFPNTTQAFLAINDVHSLAEHFNNTPYGKLAADPAMKPFWNNMKEAFENRWSILHERLGITLEDLGDVAGGELGIGLIQPKKKEAAIALTVDITGHIPQAKALLDKIVTNLEAKNTLRKKTKETDATDPMVQYLFLTWGEEKQSKIYESHNVIYCLRGNYLCVTDNMAVMQGILARLANKSESNDSLSDVPGYQMISKRCAADAAGETSQFRWFVNPVGYAEVDRALTPVEQRSRGKTLSEFLQNQGFTGIQGVGGQVYIAEKSRELMHRTFIYAPPPRKNSIEMVKLVNCDDFTPQDWVPRDTVTYSTFYLDIMHLFKNFEPFFDEMWGGGEEGVWHDVLESLEKDPHGPLMDLEKELIVHLGQRITLVTDCQKPIAKNSERFLLAIEVKKGHEPEVARAIEKIMKVDSGAKKREIDGRVIWEISPIERGKTEKSKAGPVDEDSEFNPDGRLFPYEAVTVAEGQYFVASNVDMLLKALKPHAPEELLRNDADFRRVSEIIEQMRPEEKCIRVFSRTGEELGQPYEMIRGNLMPKSESMFGRFLNQCLITSVRGKPRQQTIDGTHLPEYDMIRRYFGPAGSQTTAEKDGWFIKGFTMSPELSNEEKDNAEKQGKRGNAETH